MIQIEFGMAWLVLINFVNVNQILLLIRARLSYHKLKLPDPLYKNELILFEETKNLTYS